MSKLNKISASLKSLKETEDLLAQTNKAAEDTSELDSAIEAQLLAELDMDEEEMTDEPIAEDLDVEDTSEFDIEDINLEESDEEIEIEDEVNIDEPIEDEEIDLDLEESEEEMIDEPIEGEPTDDMEIDLDLEESDEEISLEDEPVDDMDLDLDLEESDEPDTMEKIYEELQGLKERQAKLKEQDSVDMSASKPELVAEKRDYQLALKKLGKMYTLLEGKYSQVKTAAVKLKKQNEVLKLDEAKAIKVNGILANTSLSPANKKKLIASFDECKSLNEVQTKYKKVISVIKEATATSKLNTTVASKKVITSKPAVTKTKAAVITEAQRAQIRKDYLMGISNEWEEIAD